MQTPVRKRFSLASLSGQALMWVLASSMGAVAIGQETAADDDQVAPPERIARLSYTQGGVSLQAVGETEWATAPVNRPMAPGDYLRTESDGRAEIQADEATVRLGAGTGFSFVALEDRALRMRMSSGVVNLRVRELSENNVIEVETPQAVTSILRPGNYRLEVNEAGDTTVVKVSSGMLEARGAGGQSLVVRAQQSATLTGTDRLAFTTGTLGAPDSFDEWSLERDLRSDNALATESSKYVPPDVVGAEDLEGYGTWRSEPEYGYVWSPTRVVAGWSPYSYGRYTYVGGWGWTWIDDSPWGFAPYHYGSWVTIGNRWCWVPGPRHTRPIGRPGRPVGDSAHNWHVPRSPTRGIGTRDLERGANGLVTRDIERGANGIATRPSFNNQPGRDDSRSGTSWRTNPVDRERDVSGGRYGNVPGYGPRYVHPGQPRADLPQAGAPAVGGAPSVGAPPTSTRSPDDRRMRIPSNQSPRNEMPRSTFPRQETRFRAGGDRQIGSSPQPRAEMPRREMSRPQVARPSPPPQQQSRPDTGRPTFNRGGGDRGNAGGGRPGAERR